MAGLGENYDGLREAVASCFGVCVIYLDGVIPLTYQIILLVESGAMIEQIDRNGKTAIAHVDKERPLFVSDITIYLPNPSNCKERRRLPTGPLKRS